MNIEIDTANTVMYEIGHAINGVLPVVALVIAIPISFYIARNIIQAVQYAKRW